MVNDVVPMLNLMKISWSVQKLEVGKHRDSMVISYHTFFIMEER
jgi:hypothetical protein